VGAGTKSTERGGDGTVNTLNTAKDCMAAFENDGNRSFRNVEIAKAYAAIAQAEQLKRIADMMEGYLSVNADPTVFEGIERGIR
jgi:hypothetical protein